jgi:putative heme-binding domain-containing protein
VALKPPAYLLAEILDPNRNLDARYMGFTVVLQTGQTLTGLVTSESPNSVTLSSQDGKQHSLLRTEIERMSGSGKSLMPEGLEQQISPQDMADLLAFLAGHPPPPKKFLGNEPTLVKQSADGRLYLPARFAEVRGPTLVFAVPAYALEYWNSLDDRASWNVEIAKAGRFEVFIEYSCAPESGGNTLALEGGEQVLTHTVRASASWQTFIKKSAGRISLPAGTRRLTIKAIGPNLKEALFDLRSVELVPVRD